MLESLFSRRRVATHRYVELLMGEPPQEDVSWLAGIAAEGDVDRATWELRYLRRALGLLVAQRDALDDRTGSEVAHALGEAMRADRRVAANMVRVAERQFNERLSGYREMMALRGMGEGAGERVARTFLLLAGTGRTGWEELERARAIVERLLTELGEGLRTAFGEARLPAAGAG